MKRLFDWGSEWVGLRYCRLLDGFWVFESQCVFPTAWKRAAERGYQGARDQWGSPWYESSALRQSPHARLRVCDVVIFAESESNILFLMSGSMTRRHRLQVLVMPLVYTIWSESTVASLCGFDRSTCDGPTDCSATFAAAWQYFTLSCGTASVAIARVFY